MLTGGNMGNRAEIFQKIKQQLIKEKDELVKKLKENQTEEFRKLKDDIGDNFDKASQEISMGTMLALSDLDNKKLEDIEIALNKIELGTYGFCEECGDEIPIPRLEYLPFAKYCIDCQEEIEEEGKKLTGNRKTVVEDGLYKREIGEEDDIIKLEDE